MAKKIVLSCSKCASRNYTVPARAESSTRLELKKILCSLQWAYRA